MRAILRSPLVLLLVLLAAPGCTRRGSQAVSGQPERVTLVVENQNYLDMTIYVFNGAQRRRLGDVPGLSTRTLTIPATMVFGVSSLRFQADPVGGDVSPVTQEITVTEGDELRLVIPA